VFALPEKNGRHPFAVRLQQHNEKRSEVLLIVTLNITGFWDVLSYSLVDHHQHFGGAH
jgi:hypothetical protein